MLIEIPKFTTDQKLELRTLQLNVLVLREQARLVLEQAAKSEQTLMKNIREMADKLGVDLTSFTFDLGELVFKPKEPVSPAE